MSDLALQYYNSVDKLDLHDLEILSQKITSLIFKKKAKENKTTLIHAQTDKRERKLREAAPKEDKVKEDIINQVAELLGSIADRVDITNKTKMIEFDLDGDHYKFDLIRQRKPKNK